MKLLIIEDEIPAAKRLSKLIKQFRPDAQILEVIDSVDGAVKWLNTFEKPDLLFMDIQLSDGLSFDIFNQFEVQSPVIFTTAYDQYTLKAFKVNSVDYLLKPIDPDELEKAFLKFDKIYRQPQSYDKSAIENLLKAMTQKEYKSRFVVKTGQQLAYISVDDISYFYSEDGVLCAKTQNGKRHLLDYTLEQLEQVLDPAAFFRVNRKMITRINAIHKISTYFNNRLKLELQPKTDLEVIVSRDRVNDFKKWLDN
jgi:DNA-binding LytR/AlgR family response regulator